jgi:hypothetical protein
MQGNRRSVRQCIWRFQVTGLGSARGRSPFISDSDLESALDKAQVSSKTTDAALDACRDARIAGLRAALAILAILPIMALFLAQRIPTRQPKGPAASG